MSVFWDDKRIFDLKNTAEICFLVKTGFVYDISIIKDFVREKFYVNLYFTSYRLASEPFDMDKYENFLKCLRESGFVRVFSNLYYDSTALRTFEKEFFTITKVNIVGEPENDPI